MGLSGLVSDGAKALVKLAFVDWDVPVCQICSISCLEQIHRQCNCPSTGATAKQHQGLQEKLKTLSSSQVSAQITVLQAQQDKLEIDRQDYQQNLHALSQTIHPLTSTPGISIWVRAPRLQSILANVERLGQTYALTRAGGNRCLATTDTTPIRDNSCLVAGYPSSLFPNPRPGYTTLLTILLPWVYWHQQTEKTRHTELKQGYHQATQQAHARFLAHSFTHTETAQQQQWIDGGMDVCQVQRTSSAVEGRNGYLSRLHHSHGASRNKP